MKKINGTFHPIDMADWERQQYFYYFTKMLPTGYSMTVEMDITETYDMIKEKGSSFFAAYLYTTLKQLAVQKEFRITTIDGKLGYFDVLHPSFAVLHEDDKTMSNMWIAYADSFITFSQRYEEDMAKFKNNHGILAKPDMPPANSCMIGMVPWIEFTHYCPIPYAQSDCYFPVIQAGKYFTRQGRRLMPYSITIHHAVADGYHVAAFLDGVQNLLSNPETWIDK